MEPVRCPMKIAWLVALTYLVSGLAVWAAEKPTKRPQDICEIHQVKMKKTVVPFSYGPAAEDPIRAKEQQQAAKHFPNARDHVYGGPTPSGKTQAEIYVCPACQAAKQKSGFFQGGRRNAEQGRR